MRIIDVLKHYKRINLDELEYYRISLEELNRAEMNGEILIDLDGDITLREQNPVQYIQWEIVTLEDDKCKTLKIFDNQKEAQDYFKNFKGQQYQLRSVTYEQNIDDTWTLIDYNIEQ